MMKVHLLRKMILPVEHPGRGLVIECESGMFWVTQMYDAEDHILKPGQKFMAGPRGSVVVEGLRDGWVSIGEKEEAVAA